MAIVQDAYDISTDILTKILTGEYRRIGSVVRYAVGAKKGQIVKHLKPVKLEAADQAKGLVSKALGFAKNNKKALVITGVVVGVASIGAGIYYKVKNHENKVITEFRAALSTYIDAIRKGAMDLEKIDSLLNTLEVLKAHRDYEKISIQLTTEDLELLISRIHDYTLKLAKDNSVKLTEEELGSADVINAGPIINLQTHLKAQKRIFDVAA